MWFIFNINIIINIYLIYTFIDNSIGIHTYVNFFYINKDKYNFKEKIFFA